MMKLMRDIRLAPLTTFQVGGVAKYFVKVRTLLELKEVCMFSKKENLAVFVLGEGSNILVSDKGFSGLVVKIEMKGLTFKEVGDDSVEVHASAGENWDAVVKACVRRSLYGIENLSFIPGTVGATPVQNVGAYGVEVKDVIDTVSVYDKDKLLTRQLSNKECNFSYRDSIFKHKEGSDFIVTSVSYRLRKTPVFILEYKDVANELKERKIKDPTLSEVRNVIGAIRKRKFPDIKKVGTAGSFFKNPILNKTQFHSLHVLFPDIPAYTVEGGKMKVPLAWVLERIGWKGYQRGHVGVSEKQPLVLIHLGGGSASELKELAENMRSHIKKKTGIDVENEVTTIED